MGAPPGDSDVFGHHRTKRPGCWTLDCARRTKAHLCPAARTKRRFSMDAATFARLHQQGVGGDSSGDGAFVIGPLRVEDAPLVNEMW